MRYDIAMLDGADAAAVAQMEKDISGVNYDIQQLNIIYDNSLNECTCEYICFFPPNTAPGKEFFNELDKTFNAEASAIVCRTLPCECEIYYDPITFESPVLDGVFAVKRDAYVMCGGLDTRLPTNAAFIDLSMRLRNMGKKIFYAANVIASMPSMTCESFGAILYGQLLLRIKLCSIGAIFNEIVKYIAACKNPPHYDGVRRELATNFGKALCKFVPLYGYRLFYNKQRKGALNLYCNSVLEKRGAFVMEKLLSKPLVSVIVRTCARTHILREALISLRGQTYKNLEIIVCEDNEPSSKKMVLSEFSDLNINYLCKNEHIGRSKNGNMGLATASGEFCMFLDDDDLLYSEHIEALLCCAQKNPNAGLILGSAAALFVDITPEGLRIPKQIKPMVFDRIDVFTMCQGCRIPIQTAIFRRELFLELGGLHEGLDAHEDWAMWLHFMAQKTRTSSRGADCARITSLFVQSASEADASNRLEQYSKDDDAFLNDNTLTFNVSLREMREYYRDMLADVEHLKNTNQLDDYLKKNK